MKNNNDLEFIINYIFLHLKYRIINIKAFSIGFLNLSQVNFFYNNKIDE